MTETHNRFLDLYEKSADILKLRSLPEFRIVPIDQQVLEDARQPDTDFEDNVRIA